MAMQGAENKPQALGAYNGLGQKAGLNTTNGQKKLKDLQTSRFQSSLT